MNLNNLELQFYVLIKMENLNYSRNENRVLELKKLVSFVNAFPIKVCEIGVY